MLSSFSRFLHHSHASCSRVWASTHLPNHRYARQICYCYFNFLIILIITIVMIIRLVKEKKRKEKKGKERTKKNINKIKVFWFWEREKKQDSEHRESWRMAPCWWCCCSCRLNWVGLALGLWMPFGVPLSGNQAPKLTPFSHFSLTPSSSSLSLSLQNYNGRRHVFVLQGTCSLVPYLLLSTVKPRCPFCTMCCFSCFPCFTILLTRFSVYYFP